MSKKILTLDQLVSFCASNNLLKFSAEETGYKLCVQIPSTYEKFEERSTDSMCYGKVKLLHTNRNRNGSNVTKDAAEKCMSSIKYKPLLANFCEINGVKDFTSHDIEIDEDGKVNYIEHQIGCFTVDEPYMEYDEEKDRYYIYAYVAIPKEYTPAFEVIERKGGTKISAELGINKMSYDAEKKELLLEDIEVLGATCLGTNPETGTEVSEGMEGARLDIEDFAEKKNFEFSKDEKLIETLEKLNDTLSNLNINNTTKGGNTQVDKFNELLNKYEKTVEDITFEYEGLSDEELELAFAEAFEEPKKKIEDDDTPVVTPNEEDAPIVEGDNTTPIEKEPEETQPVEPSEPEDNEGDETDPGLNSLQYSVSIGDIKKEFSLSLADKQFAAYSLINDTYAEQDNDFYDVDVYEESKEIVMHGWYSGKHYKQAYKVKGDIYSLKGDRVEVFAQYLTTDEIAKLDSMKANYEEISIKLSKYETEPEKMQILESVDYSSIADKDEFAELKKQENHFDLSVDELKAKADEIILSYAKRGQLNFSSTESDLKSSVGMKKLVAFKSTKRSRYGGLGKKED